MTLLIVVEQHADDITALLASVVVGNLPIIFVAPIIIPQPSSYPKKIALAAVKLASG